MIFLLVSTMGFIIPFQSAIAGRLGQRLKSSYLSSFLSCLCASLTAFVITFISKGSVLIPDNILVQFSSLLWTAGVFFAIGTTLLIYVIPKIGGMLCVVLPLLGQIITSILIEHWGLFSVPRKAITSSTFISVLCLLVGVFLVISSKTKTKQKSEIHKIDYFLAFIAGISMALQFIITGKVGQLLHSSPHAAMFTFIEASLCLLVFLAFHFRKKESVALFSKEKIPNWMYISGILLAFILPTNALASSLIGPNLTVIISLLSQLLAGVIIDHFGLLHVKVNKINWQQITGLMLVVGSIFLLKFLS
ncbi:DMT family transporter [Streptococcus massiliensis]|uniref:Cell wall surface protein n=1 Tax=Streptococcus massiliensis TaxID=313439 RepID=A0A380KXJ3_9STRE|nr:DMT family transporter [Streptococcus massiliensis]SUN75837.1 cell wall surface protein [Streptococcus massiliensis]